MMCSTCGAENRAGAKFCTECGSPLPRACPSCGSPVGPQAKFCDECGTPLAPSAAPVAFSAIAGQPAEARDEFERLQAGPWLDRVSAVARSLPAAAGVGEV